MRFRTLLVLVVPLFVLACGGGGGESRVGNEDTNRAPVVRDVEFTTDEGTPLEGDFSASDPNGDTIFFSILDFPEHGIVNTPQGGGGAGEGRTVTEFTYIPDTNYNGVDTFTYSGGDGFDVSGIATVTITINPVNDIPTARDDSAAAAVDETIMIDVLDNDSDLDDDVLAISSVDNPTTAGGVAAVEDPGTPADTADDTISYTPPVGFSGTDTFSYTINDGNGETATATVTVTVGTTVAALKSAPLTLAVDVLPGACPNAIALIEKGSVAVAVLGSAEFDLALIDPLTVRLAGVAADRSALEDVAYPASRAVRPEDPWSCNPHGMDGYVDLVLSFPAAAVLAVQSIADGTVQVQIEGILRDGRRFSGTDLLTIERQ